MSGNEDSAVLAEAADWFARLCDAAASDADRRAWQAWLDAAPEHARAWARVEAIAQPFSQLCAHAPPTCSRQALLEARRTPRRQVLRLLGAGGMTLGSLALLGKAIPRTLQWQILATLHADTATGVGEIRFLKLDDGSRLTLNTTTQVQIDFTDDWRRVVLYEGEIMLDSGADAGRRRRPLIVETIHGRITALGTRFSVLRVDEQTRVSVFDGAVLLVPEAGSMPVRINAGSSGVLSSAHAATAGAALAAREGWATGQLVADDVALGDFLGELGRYTAIQLEVAPDIRDLRLVGVYRIEQPARDVPLILAALESSLPVRVIPAGNRLLRLVAR